MRRWANVVLVESQGVLPVGIPDYHPARELRPFDPKCEIASRDFLTKGWELSIDLKAETGVGGVAGQIIPPGAVRDGIRDFHLVSRPDSPSIAGLRWHFS